MATVLLLLDAFRHDYLSEAATPFLWNCAQEGEFYERVVQSFGFCERSEILSGLRGDETGFLTAIGYDPLQSSFGSMKGMTSLHYCEKVALVAMKLLGDKLGAKVDGRLRRSVDNNLRARGATMPSYRIPFPWLKYFRLTEDFVDHRKPEAFPRPSLLTELNENGRRYYYDTFTALGFQSPYRSDQSRLDAVGHELSKGDYDFYLIYLAAPDMVGHRHGPKSPQLQAAVSALDQSLKSFVASAERTSPGNRYVFVGDHGMHTVSKSLDLEPSINRLLRTLGLRKGVDVVYFLDSTIARFWQLTDRCNRLFDNLRSMPLVAKYGTWMDNSTAKRFHIRWPDRQYGDWLWAANPGVVLFPDFFHRFVKCKGMHGYDPQLADSQGLCIHWGRDVRAKRVSEAPLTEVYQVLKKSLKL